MPAALPYSHVSVEHEIACVDAKALEGGSGTSHICAIGLWTDISARVLRLPSLDTLYTQPLGGGDAKPAHLLYMCIQFFFFFTCIYVHFICTCTCIYVCIRAGTCVHVFTCTCIHVHVYNVHVHCSFADILPRSILMASFSGHVYLLVALGDGTLHYYQMDAESGVQCRSSTCCCIHTNIHAGIHAYWYVHVQ